MDKILGTKNRERRAFVGNINSYQKTKENEVDNGEEQQKKRKNNRQAIDS